MTTKSSLQNGKSRFSRAVPRRNSINFPLLAQRSCNALNLRVWSRYQMESAEDYMDALVNSRRRPQNPLNSGM
jgi:hypothetical protein